MDSAKAHYVAATAILVCDGKYLIVKRALHEKSFPGQWTVPGGKVERKDYEIRTKDTSTAWYNVLEDALRREVLEEVGLEIWTMEYLTSLTFIRGDEIPVLVLSFFAEHTHGEVKLSDELTEYKWVTLEEAKQYDLISGIWEEIAMLDHFLKTGEKKVWKKE